MNWLTENLVENSKRSIKGWKLFNRAFNLKEGWEILNRSCHKFRINFTMSYPY